MVSVASCSSPTIFQRIQYRLVGPTTAHIEYECYLLLCMILLLIATIRGLYKESSFTTAMSTDHGSTAVGTYFNGDCTFVLLVSLVLSRHILIRIYCAFDPSTHVACNIFGLISHLMQTTIFASSGHCFDRPPPPIQLAILQSYHNSSSANSNNGGGFSDRGLIGGGASVSGNTFLTTSINNNINPNISSSGGMLASISPATTPTAAERMIHVTGGVLDINYTRESTKGNTVLSLSHILPSSFIYGLQILRKVLWFPLTRIIGTPQVHVYPFISFNDNMKFYSSSSSGGESRRARNNSNNTMDSSASMVQWLSRNGILLQQFLYQTLFLHGPSFRFLLTTKICLVIFGQLLLVWTHDHTADFSSVPFGFLSYFSGGTAGSRSRTTKENLHIHTHDVKKMFQIAEQESAPMVGHYVQQLKPSVAGTFWILIGFGTLYCLIVFTRIVFPLPDLLTTGSVSKDANYVRSHIGSTGTTPTSGSSGKKGHHHHGHQHSNNASNSRRQSNVGWLSKLYARLNDWFNNVIYKRSTNNSMSDVIAWMERQYRAISTNRFYACVFVVLGRVAENIIVVGLLPRTQFACRVMGHCSSGLSLWELSRVLYPGGLNTPKRMDGSSAMEFMEHDTFSAIWTVAGVLATSSVLLLTQTLVLNRSYLSSRAYHSLEWELVSKDTKKNQRQSDDVDLPWISNSHHQSSPDVWDGRRKYVRGEEVYYPDWFGALYRARVNSPESYPKANNLHAFDEELSCELGHPATSRILATFASIQFICAMLYCITWIVCVICGFHLHSYGLVWAMLSCFVSVHGVLATTSRAAYTSRSKNGKKIMSRAMQQLQKLNGEIIRNNS